MVADSSPASKPRRQAFGLAQEILDMKVGNATFGEWLTHISKQDMASSHRSMERAAEKVLSNPKFASLKTEAMDKLQALIGQDDRHQKRKEELKAVLLHLANGHNGLIPHQKAVLRGSARLIDGPLHEFQRTQPENGRPAPEAAQLAAIQSALNGLNEALGIQRARGR